jgi:hypothetical protein
MAGGKKREERLLSIAFFLQPSPHQAKNFSSGVSLHKEHPLT